MISTIIISVIFIGGIIVFIICDIKISTKRQAALREEQEKARLREEKEHEKILEDNKRERVLGILSLRAKYLNDKETYEAIKNNSYTRRMPTLEEMDAPNFVQEYKIAGINFRKNIKQYAGAVDAILIPEPQNPHDPNAIRIEVYLEGIHLGYISADETDEVREFVDNQFPMRCQAIINEEEDYDNGLKFYTGNVIVFNPNWR